MVFRPLSPLTSLICVDALCINQNDEEERSHQVQLMGAIYSNASNVISWLGADNNGKMTAAITAIKSVQHVAATVPGWLEDLHWMQDYPPFLEVKRDPPGVPNQSWGSLQTFFSDPYWGRVWVLQEMVLAQKLWIMVGNYILDYEGVVDSVQLVRQFSLQSSQGKGLIPYEILYLLRLPEWIPTTNHMVVDEFRGYTKNLEDMNNASKLEAILSTLEYQASDPRDKVYALQGLLGNFITPDYTKSTKEVYSGLMLEYIANFQDLYLLRFSGTARYPSQVKGLPSWAPDWQAISSIDGFQAFPTQASRSDNGMDTFCSFQAQVLDERYLRVNVCICDVISDAEPIFNADSVKFVRIYRRNGFGRPHHVIASSSVP
ncbi:hypothetical protein N0V90_006611 [Kalmusia sp. IMI 367209]|nr:hypothetical protein N0V90_006611 [Kalmusia sp. IMI 367209]